VRRLLDCVRGGDTVSRLGGDEFAVLGRGRTGERTTSCGSAARLESAFAEPFCVDGRSLSVGASIGRAVWPADVDGRRCPAASCGRGHVRGEALARLTSAVACTRPSRTAPSSTYPTAPPAPTPRPPSARASPAPRWRSRSTASCSDLARPLPDGASDQHRHQPLAGVAGPDPPRRRARAAPPPCWTLYPGTKISIGPPIEDGFYYDFEFPDDVHDLRPRLRGARGQDARAHQGDEPFVRQDVPAGEAIQRFIKEARTTRSS
jgi:hypothetical protein